MYTIGFSSIIIIIEHENRSRECTFQNGTHTKPTSSFAELDGIGFIFISLILCKMKIYRFLFQKKFPITTTINI